MLLQSFRRFASAIFLVSVLHLAVAQQAVQSPQAERPAEQPSVAKDAGEALSDKQAAPPTEGAKTPAVPGIRIGTGDLIDINVYGVPDLNQKTRVTSSGDIYMPLVGYVRVDGLTIEQAQEAIEQKLTDGKFLNDPHVTIFIAEYASGVTIMGEVQRPGVYPIFGSRRLFDIISAAGGLTDRAGRVATITHRDHPQEPVTVAFSADPQNTSANVDVAQGDTIVVTRGGVVYVVGEVMQPSGFIMEGAGNFTVLKALALAHGPARYAKLDNAKIIRKKPDGSYAEIPVRLRKILDAKEKDVTLEADDIVFVPASGGKRAAEQTMNSILSIAGGLAVRIP